MRCFCIARGFLRVSFSFGCNLGDRLILSGVAGVGVLDLLVVVLDLLVVDLVDPVIGDTTDAGDDALI